MTTILHKKSLLKWAAACSVVLLASGCAAWLLRPASANSDPSTVDAGVVTLEAVHKLAHPEVSESSGLVASPRITGLYWTHNDSGDGPYLYPIDAFGERWPGSPARGIQVRGARNVDWEDIAVDDAGNLIIGDVGNNANERRDLTVYFVREPDPAEPSVEVLRALRIEWPEQEAFPPALRNFDCEAIFWADARLHFLMKHRSDKDTVLYRLEEARAFPQPSRPVRVGTFPIDGMVTAADTSPDGLRLAVLTYGAVWLFERPAAGADFFSSPVRRLRIRAWQCEGIAFEPEGTHLRITNEQRSIYRVALADLPLHLPNVPE